MEIQCFRLRESSEDWPSGSVESHAETCHAAHLQNYSVWPSSSYSYARRIKRRLERYVHRKRG
jgi:hypothetical protein